MPDRFEAVQNALLCGSCGGQQRYDPASNGLICDHCGAQTDINDDHLLDARREMAYDPKKPDEPPEIDHAHLCQTCGGEVVFVGKAVSDRCPYCNGPVVLNAGHAHYIPSGMIPFAITQSQAQDQLLGWAANRVGAPSDLQERVKQGDIAAVYAPFWTFDADKTVNYSARKRVRRGKSTYLRSIDGVTGLKLDDQITAASDHVTPAIRDGIMHGFDPALLRPYLPEYLAGFAAELHGTNVTDGLGYMMQDLKPVVHEEIKRDAGSRALQNIRYSSKLRDVRFRRVLLPLWILHYTYGGKAKRIVTSGIDGKTFGERPFSHFKLAGYSFGLATGVFAIGALLGMAASGG